MERVFSDDMNRSFTDFPKEEYEQRYARARIAMEEQRLDALLITEQSNFIYFTGHRSAESPIERRIFNNWIAIFPRTGEPVVIIPFYEVNNVLKGTWIRDVRIFMSIRHPIDEPGLTTSESIVGTLKDMGFGDSRIGCELGMDQILGISYNDLMKIKEQLPRANFVDASDLLNNLRLVKSKAEVEACRKAAEIASRAAQRTFKEIGEGMMGRDVARVTLSNLINEGAEGVNLLLAHAFDFTQEMGFAGSPTERPLKRGQTVTLDMQARYKGYWSDIARTGVVGKAQERQKRAYRRTLENQREIMRQAFKPGVSADEFVHFGVKAHENIDAELTRGKKIFSSGTYGGSAHGVGLYAVEYPLLALGQNVILQPRMVFAFNATFTTSFGYFSVEENVVITDDGYEILSIPEGAEELPVI